MAGEWGAKAAQVTAWPESGTAMFTHARLAPVFELKSSRTHCDEEVAEDDDEEEDDAEEDEEEADETFFVSIPLTSFDVAEGIALRDTAETTAVPGVAWLAVAFAAAEEALTQELAAAGLK